MDFEKREDRGPGSAGRGRKLARERAAYFQLMQQGYSSVEACQIVGINYRTGKRWRNGHHSRGVGKKPTPPIYQEASASCGPSRYLRENDRIHIADRYREKASMRTIARELGRSPSTISREIRRNGTAVGDVRPRRIYRPHAAQSRADARRPRPKPGKIGQNSLLRDFIQRHLALRWSPQQICRILRRRFPGAPEMHVVHETIYQALYVQGRGELRRELTRALRTGRARRVPHRRSYKRRARNIPNMVMISERPADALERAIPGHWEGDLLIGKEHQSAIGTLVERTTRYVMLVHLPAGHSAPATRDALVKTVTTLPPHLRKSLTWDQGSEMTAHRAFTIATDIPFFFCDPGSPWQRGSNENTNGLLRQYFPKGTDLARYTRQHLDDVAAELNSRPRKTLDWDTPAERFTALMATG